ncbi:MAG TPA: WYL domain-containing protein [Mycobacteriales bacterium]|nr:WYL domain-containing protein [Mycobacteriales bacterium]
MSTRSEMPGRLLRLLTLLQSRRTWSGPELAERLGVTDRTLRRDIDRLRALDYPVAGTTGAAGGYRLTPGGSLPPLQLDDEEAVAMAVALAVPRSGFEESSMRALVKLGQVLPARLRPRLAALGATTVAVPDPRGIPGDPATLGLLATCARDREIVTFEYSGGSAGGEIRRVEPHHLITVRGRWYVITYDLRREDWRIFRTDRIVDPRPTRHRFTAREVPGGDPAEYLRRSFATAAYRYTARIRVRLAADAVRAGIFGTIPGELEDETGDACTVRLSADSVEIVAQYVASIAALGADFTLEGSPPVLDRLRMAGVRLAAASGPAG